MKKSLKMQASCILYSIILPISLLPQISNAIVVDAACTYSCSTDPHGAPQHEVNYSCYGVPGTMSDTPVGEELCAGISGNFTLTPDAEGSMCTRRCPGLSMVLRGLCVHRAWGEGPRVGTAPISTPRNGVSCVVVAHHPLHENEEQNRHNGVPDQ